MKKRIPGSILIGYEARINGKLWEMKTNLQKAHELLCLCAFPEPVKNLDEFHAWVSQIQDWDSLLQKVAFHRLQSRFYLFLKKNEAPSILDPTIWHKIEAIHFAAQAQVLALEGELERVLLPAFEQAKIDILLLKGAALNRTVYREKAVRSFDDLDLLIHPSKLSVAESFLKKRGYENIYLSHFPSRWHERQLRPFEDPCAAVWIQPERNAVVDLHTELFEPSSPFYLPSDWAWQDADAVSIGRGRAYLPSPNRLLMHLVFHLAKHLGAHQNFFGWYLDLDACLRHFKERINGPFCTNLILGNSFGDKILRIFAFLKTHFQTPLPRELDVCLEERKTKPLDLEDIFSPPSEVAAFFDTDWKDRPGELLASWRRLPGTGKKIWFFIRWVFPDADYLKRKYPFQSPFKKANAFFRHLGVMALKGWDLVRYIVRKRRE